MGAAKCLSKATKEKAFEKTFAALGNSAAIGYSLESLYGKFGPDLTTACIRANLEAQREITHYHIDSQHRNFTIKIIRHTKQKYLRFLLTLNAHKLSL